MIKKIIEYLTKKKPKTMTKHSEQPENKGTEKSTKNLIAALNQSNENLKIMKKQFSFDESHFISLNIKSNDKILESYK